MSVGRAKIMACCHSVAPKGKAGTLSWRSLNMQGYWTSDLNELHFLEYRQAAFSQWLMGFHCRAKAQELFSTAISVLCLEKHWGWNLGPYLPLGMGITAPRGWTDLFWADILSEATDAHVSGIRIEQWAISTDREFQFSCLALYFADIIFQQISDMGSFNHWNSRVD